MAPFWAHEKNGKGYIADWYTGAPMQSDYSGPCYVYSGARMVLFNTFVEDGERQWTL